MKKLLNLLNNPDGIKFWILNNRYCPNQSMTNGQAVVLYTGEYVEKATPFAFETISEISKYNLDTFKKAYDIERKERYNINAKDGSRTNAIWKFNKDVKKGHVILFVSGSDIIGYYIVVGESIEIVPGDDFCANIWEAKSVCFKTPISINGTFGSPFFKGISGFREQVKDALNTAIGSSKIL